MPRHVVFSIALLCALPLAAQPTSGDTSLAAVERWIAARAVADSFSGVVLVARDGVPLLRRAYGFADRERRMPNRPETKFNLASLDKLITRVAIWQLVAEGKLSLDAPLGRYLPDYPNAAVRERVTARQLLAMSSGVGNFWNAEYYRRHREIRTVDDYLSLFARDTLLFEPGTSRAYSNGGYIILGKLIEVLAGRSYYDYVRERIAEPAGMRHTRHYLIDAAEPDLAIGYTTEGSPQRDAAASPAANPRPRSPNTFSLAGRGSPAGGGYSTVDDFLRFDQALRRGTLVAEPYADSVTGPGFRQGRGAAFAYGGGGTGANTQYAAFPDGYTIIVFSNYDPPAATTVLREIARALGKSAGASPTRRPAS